jgi:hypothetical protein
MAKSITRQSRNDLLQASLISLTERCPVVECNPEDCPLFRLRKMKPAARLKWFKALSEEDLDFIAAYHHVCMNVKLECPPISSVSKPSARSTAPPPTLSRHRLAPFA